MENKSKIQYYGIGLVLLLLLVLLLFSIKNNNNKILIIISTNDINYDRDIISIKSLKRYIIDDPKLRNYKKDIAFISSNKEDLDKFDNIFDIKYKITDKSKQLSKVCNLIDKIKEEYFWYIKTRPDFELYGYIDFDKLNINKINSRLREYHGPSIYIKNGFSDPYKKDIHKSTNNKIVMDDMIYIFNNKVKSQFIKLSKDQEVSNYKGLQHEWYHTDKLKIPINPISINGILRKHNFKSQDLKI